MFKRFFTAGFLFIALLALFATICTLFTFGDIHPEHILNNGHGVWAAGSHILWRYFLLAVVPAAFGTIILTLFNFSNLSLIFISLFALLFSFWKLHFFSYLINTFTYTDLYQKEYVDPEKIKFSFPEQKRNLIVLYLESVESDYADPLKAKANLLPQLSNISDAISFNGYHQLQAQDFTIAAFVNSMCAVPLKSNFYSNSTEYHNFLTGLECFPHILQDNGYHTTFIRGADLNFARNGIFLQQHGFSNVAGRDEIKDKFSIDLKNHLGTSWGLRDRSLYHFAKAYLTDLAQNKQPFMFAMITLDTHGPDIYLDPKCPKIYDDLKSNVIACADQMAYEFINWIKDQDFYQNTTLVVLGDHTESGGNGFYPELKDRKIVNLYFNLPKSLQKNNQEWTSFDTAPTILEALGIQFEKGQFGLGRSLFNLEPTLRAKLSDQLDIEIARNAPEYDNFTKTSYYIESRFEDYPTFGIELNAPKEIMKYTAFGSEVLNQIWSDNLSFTLPKTNSSELVLKLKFKLIFNNATHRLVDIFANNEKIDHWDFGSDEDQPFEKEIHIPKRLIADNGKIEFLFKTDNLGKTLLGVSLGIISLNWSEN